MNWKITLLEIAEFGLFVFVLWIPFRMGRVGIRDLWSILVGWFLLLSWALTLGILSIKVSKIVDSDSANALPDGQIGAPLLLFGWAIAWGAAALGRNGLKSIRFVKSQNILDEIVEQKKIEVAKLPARIIAAGDLRDAMLEHGERRDFLGALRKPRSGDIGLIAEVKKASPSMGVICKDFDPVRIAKEYEAAGASCLSVLTDEKFFQGSLDYLRQIRAAVKLPLLRKDFIIDERQILEAIEWGADAILLIVAILTHEQLAKFHSLAIEAGLAVLVEVHAEEELERALKISPALIGVNNRNLKTFQVDLATTERLAAKMEDGGLKMAKTSAPLLGAESGINSRADVERLKKCGAKAILVGESLMKNGDIQAKVRELIGF
jgi:indole-3-glycerol phosphate synthase